MKVRVTFHVEASDPDDDTGLTNDDWERIVDGGMQLGAIDEVKIERVPDDD